MKLFNSLILIAALSISACAQSKQFKPEKGMKQIIPLYSSMEVEVGDQLYYSAGVHGSVGIQASCYSEFDSILQFKESHFAYDDLKKSEMPGGDAATKTFIFTALKAGTSRVMIKEHFRGELRQEHIVEIIVREKGAKKSENIKVEEPKAKNDGVEKLKVEKDPVQLIPLKGKETIEVGQKLIYTASVHGSVGKSVKVWEENNGVLELVNSKFEYEKVQVEGMTGGDAALETFTFEGIKVGESTVTIQEIFRGEVQNEFTIVITVVDKK